MKFGMKTPKRQDFKISFRNKGALPLNVEFFVEKCDNLPGFELMVYPIYCMVQPNALTSTCLIVKQKMEKDKEGKSVCVNNKKDIRCVLVAKFKNSSAMFSFPCIIKHHY